jgi:hypothetical protein
MKPCSRFWKSSKGRALLRISLYVAANLRFAVKIQDIGRPEARRHEIRSKAQKEE